MVWIDTEEGKIKCVDGRGGSRKGAGRKPKGITKKVSLTLSQELWNEINDFDGTCADYIRSLKEQVNDLDKVTKINVEAEKKLTENVKEVTSIKNLQEDRELTREHIEYFVKIYIDEYVREQPEDSKPPKEAINRVNQSISNLFRGSNIAEIETSTRYRSPFTNKWFSSVRNLLKKEVPQLIENEVYRIEIKKQERERKLHDDYLNSLNTKDD